MKKTFILGLFCLFILSCSKERSGGGSGEEPIKIEKTDETMLRSENLSDETVNADFSNALAPIESLTVEDLFSSSFASTAAYSQLSSASVALLSHHNMLDALKYDLGSVNNSDPHLILAAKLLNDAYNEAPLLPGNSPGPGTIWKCLGEVLGISTVHSFSSLGWSYSEVIYAIKQFGIKQFANVLIKAGVKAVTGLGVILVAAEFTWCMIWGDTDINTPYVRSGDEVLSEPLSLTNGETYFYQKYHSYLRAESPLPCFATQVYYNSANQKYYSDNSFTKLLPDGFYLLESDMNNSTYKFREVANGVVVTIAIPHIPDLALFETVDLALYYPIF